MISGIPHHAGQENLKDRKALVVFSGGQDSTTCLHWALATFKAVECIFFDYGQRHVSEKLAAEKIATDLKVPLRVFNLDFFREMGGNALVDSHIDIKAAEPKDTAPNPITNKNGSTIKSGGEVENLPNTFVPGRNLIFLTYAASYAYTRDIRDLVTGVCQTDYSGYPDCRDATMQSLEKALSLGLGWSLPDEKKSSHHLSLHTPLMFKTKAESVKWALELGAIDSLAWSHTCYEGTFPPCGKCPACELRAKGFAEAGVDDPLMQRTKKV